MTEHAVQPATTESANSSVTVTIAYPEDGLNNFLPLIKWVLVLPHVVVLAALYIVAVPVVFLTGVAIFFTGLPPRRFFNYLTGLHRWTNRVVAYSVTLTTDEYPPFSLD